MNNSQRLVWKIILFISVTCLLSCSEAEPTDPLLGSWQWAEGSRIVEPDGFNRLQRDRSSTYLVGDVDFRFTFNEDGSFESIYNIPTGADNSYQGSWRNSNNELLLNYIEPSDFTGRSDYRISSLDESNLDLQWSVQYLEFTDAQIEELTNDGTIPSWTVEEKDSLLTKLGTLITAEITLHFVKLD